MSLETLLWGSDGQGTGTNAWHYVENGLWDDAGWCLSEATCHPDSWSYGFLDEASDWGFAPIGATAFAGSMAENLAYDAYDWTAEHWQPEDWFAGETDVHIQPAWRWHDVEVL